MYRIHSIAKRTFSCYRSCNYQPHLSPFFGTFICGSLFSSLILSRMNSDHKQLMTKLYKLESDIQQLQLIIELQEQP
jgi:hypothetical protein